jgi:hypothetical protein
MSRPIRHFLTTGRQHTSLSHNSRSQQLSDLGKPSREMGVACCPGRRLRRNKRAGAVVVSPNSGRLSIAFFSSVPAGSHNSWYSAVLPSSDPSTPQPNPARFFTKRRSSVQAQCSENGSASHSSAHFIQKRQFNTLPQKQNAACIFGCRRKAQTRSFLSSLFVDEPRQLGLGRVCLQEEHYHCIV